MFKNNEKNYEGIYPTELELISHLKREPIKKENISVLVPGRNAITINIKINDTFYCKSDIKKELGQVFEQILKKYD